MAVKVMPGSYLRVRHLSDGRENEQSSGNVPSGSEGVAIDDMEKPVAPGETVGFEARINIAGDPTNNVAVIVKTPANPNGGFEVIGVSKLGTFKGGSFNADSFNQPVGMIRAGTEGTKEGWQTVKVRGTLANGNAAGLLKLQLGEAAHEAIYSFEFVDSLGDDGTMDIPAVDYDRVLILFLQSADPNTAPTVTTTLSFTTFATAVRTAGALDRDIYRWAPLPANTAATVGVNWAGSPTETLASVLECRGFDLSAPIVQSDVDVSETQINLTLAAFASQDNYALVLSGTGGVGSIPDFTTIPPSGSDSAWYKAGEARAVTLTSSPIIGVLAELKVAS